MMNIFNIKNENFYLDKYYTACCINGKASIYLPNPIILNNDYYKYVVFNVTKCKSLKSFCIICDNVKKYSIKNSISYNYFINVIFCIFISNNKTTIFKLIKELNVFELIQKKDESTSNTCDWAIVPYIFSKCYINDFNFTIQLLNKFECEPIYLYLIRGVNNSPDIENYCLNNCNDNNFIDLYKECKSPSQEHTNKYNLLTL